MAVNNKGRFSAVSKKLQDEINKVPSRQFYMLFALVVLVAVKFVFIPMQASLLEEKDQLQRMADTLKSPTLLEQQQLQMQEVLEQKRGVNQKWSDSYYQGTESQVKIDVVNKLKASATDRGLLYLSSRWLTTSKKVSERFTTLSPLTYNVTIRGDYNEIRAIIREWQSFKPVINIEEMRIRDQRAEGVVSARLKLSLYRLKQAGE